MEKIPLSSTQVIEREINLIHDKASFHRSFFRNGEPTKWVWNQDTLRAYLEDPFIASIVVVTTTRDINLLSKYGP